MGSPSQEQRVLGSDAVLWRPQELGSVALLNLTLA